jgi:transcriptional regulator with XRE-family HTH domain
VSARREQTFGERVTALRARRGLSQRELGAEVGRSESWVSQVERDVLPVERMPVLRALADALGVPVHDLRPDTGDGEPNRDGRQANDLDTLRLALAGHPTPDLLLAPTASVTADLPNLRERVARAWQLTHASAFAEVNAELIQLIPSLERARRQVGRPHRAELARLLADAYQAAASAFARLDEADAAWVAADRSISMAELGGDPLSIIAGHFRMAHAFITLRRLDQAEHIVRTGITALAEQAADQHARPEILSLSGALHLVLAVIHARSGQRSDARQAIDQARAFAARLGADRNDYETEFGPTNVDLHAIAVAVDLGDAGEALDLATGVDASRLSAERRSRLKIDLARAHAQRRHVGEAVQALLEAERQAPEQVHTHVLARQLIRDLVILAGRRAPGDLLDLARRSAAMP